MREIRVLLALLALLALTVTTVSAQQETSSIPLLEQNSSGQSGTATFTYSEDYSTVTIEINLSNGTAEPQPAHIHAGSCADLNPTPFYPLSSVVNGKSITVITEDDVANLDYDLYNQFAINVHKSAAEASVYVACGDIIPGGIDTGTTTSPGTDVGMPRTGNNNDTFLLTLVALSLVTIGTVLSFSRRNR